ncbi:MAG: peptide chain release factor N(5)-glutamine methyltransferase [Desulforhopalus sp.]
MVDLLHFGEMELLGAGVPEYEIDARLLLEHCTGKSRTEIILDGDFTVQREWQNRYLQLLERRKKREPVAYILGEKEFWSLPFYVNQNVLIPRPETEFLLDRVFALTTPANFQNGFILDLCCGSGVIAAILGKETGRSIIASDISSHALEVTRKNLTRHHLEQKIFLVQGNLFSPFAELNQFSLIVSNPPYVSSIDVKNNLMPDVASYEPHLALDGGEMGLESIQEMCDRLPVVLCPGGQCFIEIGADQGRVVKEMFSSSIAGQPGFDQVEVIADYAGRDRVVHVTMAP